MNKQAQAVIMLLLGGAVLRASLGDTYLRYVKEGLRPFLIGAGLLLVAAAIMTLWYELRPTWFRNRTVARRTAEASSPSAPAMPSIVGEPAAVEAHEDEHGHHHEPRVGWLLLLPVLGLLLISPPALGSYAAGQAGSVLTAQNASSDYPPLPKDDPTDVALLDYASRAVFDAGRSLSGRTLRLTGFITPGAGGEPMLARMVLSCCAADGRPIKVGLSGDVPAGVAPDTWVQVIGTWAGKVAKDPVNDAEVPFLQVTGWQEITPPKQQYE